METKKRVYKSLQKFTKSEMKIERVYSLNLITHEDLKTLTKAEEKKLHERINKDLKVLKGRDFDRLLEKIEPITPTEFKNIIWERNHATITSEIATLMQEYGRMPTQREIADKTEFSRQTIHKHIQEYSKHPLYKSEVESFRFMTSKVLAKMFQFAVNGDTGAAKIFLKAVGALNETNPNTTIQNQNNFIQINGMVIKQETLMQLNTEQLNTIENIMKAIPAEKKCEN
jgi:hypothetical protein